jgi:hypothetical protein
MSRAVVTMGSRSVKYNRGDQINVQQLSAVVTDDCACNSDLLVRAREIQDSAGTLVKRVDLTRGRENLSSKTRTGWLQYEKLPHIKKEDKVQPSIMGACEWFGQLSESGIKRESFVRCSKIVGLLEGSDQSGNSRRELAPTDPRRSACFSPWARESSVSLMNGR